MLGGRSKISHNGGYVSDFWVNSIGFFLGAQAVGCLSQLPMQVLLTRVIPENVEAALTAVVTGTFVFSYDVGSKMSGSFWCWLLQVDNEHLDSYWTVLIIKIPLIMITFSLLWLLPSNREV
jgi:hypothetical protein